MSAVAEFARRTRTRCLSWGQTLPITLILDFSAIPTWNVGEALKFFERPGGLGKQWLELAVLLRWAC